MLLVVRELVSGATRYRDLQRGLGRISPSVLSARLRTLIDRGIVEKLDTDRTRGSDYRLTQAGVELAPIIAGLAVWGQRWVRSRMTRDELDLELVMISVQRGFAAASFPKEHGVVAFRFSDVHGPEQRWWLLVDQGEAELCSQPPGRTEDVTLVCRVRTLAEVFTGATTVQAEVRAGRLEVRGPARLTRSVARWLRVSPMGAA
jgi:DNA-binding HxlR family transcriptional regulator